MRKLRGNARLSAKPLPTLGDVSELGAEDLYGDGPLERTFAREVHRTHAAASERPHDLVLRTERMRENGMLGSGGNGDACARNAVAPVGGGEQ